jgi:hypothetical protein
VCAVGPEQNARPDVVPHYERIGTEQNGADNAPERYRGPPKIVTALLKNLAEGKEMESDHGSSQDRSQIWTMKGVSNRTENCNCREFQNNYDNKLFAHPLCQRVGRGRVVPAQRPALPDEVNGISQQKDSKAVEKNNNSERKCMGRSETPAKPTHAKHPSYQRSETRTENQLRLKGRVNAHCENLSEPHGRGNAGHPADHLANGASVSDWVDPSFQDYLRNGWKGGFDGIDHLRGS